MIVWIGGPFGVGKSQAAYALAQRVPGSFVCDPEHLGYGLHRMTPPHLRGDFQDLPEWRRGVRATLDRHLQTFEGVLIVPMTLVNPDYYDEIIGELRRHGHTVHHVALLATRETLLRRLGKRLEGKDGWAAAQIDRCLSGLNRLDPAEHLHTDHLTHEQVVEEIARRAGVTLRTDPSHAWMRKLRRLIVGVRQIRRG